MRKLLLILFLLPSLAFAQLNASQLKKDGVKIIGNASNELTVGGSLDSTDVPDLHSEGYFNTKYLTPADAAATYSTLGHTHTFASLTSKPTTIAGYGITDFNSLGDARWSLLGHTHSFSSLTSIPTTVAGYGITDVYTKTASDARYFQISNNLSEGTAATIRSNISAQEQLNGTGFVKATGTTISYDNSTYTPTSRTLTINGDAKDLSSDRSWTISTYTECEPDAISFTPQTGVNFSTVTTSNSVVLNGGDSCVWSFVVRGGGSAQLQVNSESWDTKGIARDGDTVKVRLTSSGASLTAVTCTLYTNTRSSVFSVTTANAGILDAYGTNIAAAYSLRKLKVSYSGSAVRVRRDSDNTEQDIGFNIAGDLDQPALTTFVGAGSGYVVTWYDQSGNSRNATQATAAKQPRIVNLGVVETLNSKPTIYNNVQDGKLIASSWSAVQPENVFFVWSMKNFQTWGSSNNNIFDGTSGDVGEMRIVSSTNSEIYAGSFLTQTYTIAASTTYRTSILFNGASSNAYKDGVSQSTGDAGASNMGGLTLFNYGSGNRGLDGYISEFLIYSADKASDRAAIDANQDTYY